MLETEYVARNRTIGGARAERNEYILLHEFHKGKYICPDKVSSWEKKAAAAARANDPDNDEPDNAKKGGKKDKYKGGLVFEPKRGLWDKFILVMDFNSLYPSIIQEYNIDFTTVERNNTVSFSTQNLIACPKCQTDRRRQDSRRTNHRRARCTSSSHSNIGSAASSCQGSDEGQIGSACQAATSKTCQHPQCTGADKRL